eukprot:Partr_v1_DN26799_c1_g2_i1_m9104 putative ATP-binding cassette, sub-family G (WHITE), member
MDIEVNAGDLVQIIPCPDHSDGCIYAATPDESSRTGISWTCQTGNFCPSPRLQGKCFPGILILLRYILEDTYEFKGFYCPENTAQPMYCPAGFNCSADTARITVCPEGFYCPMATVNPLPCHFAKCAAGTQRPQNYLLGGWTACIFLVVTLVYAIAYLFAGYFKFRTQPAGDDAIPTLPTDRNMSQAALSFRNIDYKLGRNRSILHRISGQFQSGKLSGILGPSGSGKSTLLHILAGRIKQSRGTVMLNNSTDISKTSVKRSLIGFVPQDDIMLDGDITVWETLYHAALIKLLGRYDRKEIRQRVLSLISFLGLAKVMHSPIGSPRKRGISGGERKRVNIGIELVAAPLVLFLDEPTSGLDSNTSTELCIMLKQLARLRNIVVVAVIHSPPIRAFAEFDHLMVLGTRGRLVYEGPISNARPYFSSCGFPCPPGMALSEVIMDAIHDKKVLRIPLEDTWNSVPILSMYASHSRFSRWLPLTSQVRLRLTGIPPPHWLIKFWLCLQRAILQKYRSVYTVIYEQIPHLLTGLIISAAVQNFIYLSRQPDSICEITPVNLQKSCRQALDFVQQAAMFICLGIMYAGISAATSTLGDELIVHERESASGLGQSAYLIAKIIADIPRILMASFMFILGFCAFYRMRGPIIMHGLLAGLLYMDSFSIGYFISVVCPREYLSLVTTATSLAFSLILSGVLPNLDIVRGRKLQYVWAYFG